MDKSKHKHKVTAHMNEMRDNAAYQLRARPVIITLILLLLQIAIIGVVAYFFHGYIEYLTLFTILLAISLIIYITNRDMNDAYKISWLVPMAVLPIFGALLYLFLHFLPGTRAISDRLLRNVHQTQRVLRSDHRVLNRLAQFDEGAEQTARYCIQAGNWPLYDRSQSTYFSSGEAVFADFFAALEEAKDFIFLEFFIVKPGEIWNHTLEILTRKAQEGVTVRFMYDGVCSFSLPENFEEDIKNRGIEVRVFAPVKPIIATWVQNRDHRKIVVIDGKIGYTGGINLADEYANVTHPFGHWKDVGLRVEGDAVLSMTAQFLQMWSLRDGIIEKDFRFLKRHPLSQEASRGFVLPYADAPEDGHSLAENITIGLIYHAKSKVHIMTPYLVLSGEMKRALTYAAERGVDTALLVPHIPDKKIPFAVARSHYPELIKRGVQIYEYTPGFIHAKVVVTDDMLATVGSVNLDMRSFYLNFENAIFIADEKTAKDIENDFNETVNKSQKINYADYFRFPIFWRAIGRVARIFGPLI